MSTRPEAIIFNLLAARLGSLTLTPALPIAWPMREFNRPASGNYLEVAHLPNGAQGLFLERGAEARRQGLLQITVVRRLGKGEGIPAILDIAGAVEAHFESGLKLYGPTFFVTVGTPSTATPFKDGDNLRAPVTVPWAAIV